MIAVATGSLVYVVTVLDDVRVMVATHVMIAVIMVGSLSETAHSVVPVLLWPVLALPVP